VLLLKGIEMRKHWRWAGAALTAAILLTLPPADAACGSPVALQILGSGGPIAEGERAGSSAIVWLDGKAVLLVDAGSGAFVRYGEAGVRFEDHLAIAITHFHADHAADLDAILNSGGFSERTAQLPVLDPQTGAFRYLSGYLDGSDGKARLVPVEAAVDAASVVFEDVTQQVKVTAIPVEHGVVPALAYLVEIRGRTIVFAGDQNAMSQRFVEALARRRPDILVAHNVIPEGEGQPRGLHRPPASIGEMAAAIDPKLLVLSHNMQRALVHQPEGEAAIRRQYLGPMVVAGDLACFAL
jgi:ribonuclease BN (tRNA processing enzyme)